MQKLQSMQLVTEKEFGLKTSEFFLGLIRRTQTLTETINGIDRLHEMTEIIEV